ncbi:uncharacterized protein MONOS_12176 [Monocercomonoides exilis]|uniref:uncharacterized protein n=1 Tax=Monocercomonoides exilis TaxID=2049356 RepID=UPI00355A1352|nr:hypothetical protein MONOS_12176 [Monocercomonoides exilis]|eukprot:MONOS_12176.1-p1 / transcript=MONOS_12176.1 / gene=MONOS_12176 / organism=Monocercomonoides_exilis_PA203 / gene_product=unspecified product / transcript_product=unspecified product / location=Mono_scaffold00656:10203-12136(+) / protein_length=517 / sequence_SO=supercontig / SO=protein_coding / is_pseudo=false
MKLPRQVSENDGIQHEVQFELLNRCLPIHGTANPGPFILCFLTLICLLLSFYLIFFECKKKRSTMNTFKVAILCVHFMCALFLMVNMLIPFPYGEFSGLILCGYSFDSCYYIAWGLMVVSVWNATISPSLAKKSRCMKMLFNCIIWILFIGLNIFMIVGAFVEPFGSTSIFSMTIVRYMLMGTFYWVTTLSIIVALFLILRKVPKMGKGTSYGQFRKRLKLFLLLMITLNMMFLINLVLQLMFFLVPGFIVSDSDQYECLNGDVRPNNHGCMKIETKKSLFRFLTTLAPILVYLLTFTVIDMHEKKKKSSRSRMVELEEKRKSTQKKLLPSNSYKSKGGRATAMDTLKTPHTHSPSPSSSSSSSSSSSFYSSSSLMSSSTQGALHHPSTSLSYTPFPTNSRSPAFTSLDQQQSAVPFSSFSPSPYPSPSPSPKYSASPFNDQSADSPSYSAGASRYSPDSSAADDIELQVALSPSFAQEMSNSVTSKKKKKKKLKKKKKKLKKEKEEVQEDIAEEQ